VARAIRVLLVEDDDDNRDLMAEVLEAAGFAVSTAASGAEALASLDTAAVDVILTDVGMPGMGGLEVARAAKARRPGIAVAVVTGWAERDDIAGARGKDVDAVLVKPVDPDALTATVRDLGAPAAAANP
jgi:CheY-like chemotaxis protein